MTQRKVEKTVTQTYSQTITKCDLCGLETEPGHDWPTKTWHSNDETEIECRVGEVYPDGDDHRQFYRLHVCPTCFVDRFMPAVEGLFDVKFERGKR